jgi:hypothetical protein
MTNSVFSTYISRKTTLNLDFLGILTKMKKYTTKTEGKPEENTIFKVVDKVKFKFSPWLISSTHRNGTWLSSYNASVLRIRIFFVYFFGGLECVGHPFAYVAHL